jgi:glyoxylase-like metal-dependent hydrolase (beta-lactamase superfamily II)
MNQLKNLIRKSLASPIVTGLCLCFALSSALHAEAPMVKIQAPGYYRMMLGQYEITALLDGFVDLDAALLKNIAQPEIQNLLDRAFITDPHKLQTAVNTYLINTGSKLILIDAGGGKALGPNFGNLAPNLKAAGYEPGQIDAVLITHLHPDHVGGLTDSSGKPAFPKAVVYVAQAESDYWLSIAKSENVPPQYVEHLSKAHKMVQNLAAPYRTSDRWKTFKNTDLPISGIKPVPIAGHTPGHTAYEITSGNQSLIVIGDMVHCPAVQFPRPYAAVDFDSDPKAAVAVREALFQRLAKEKTLIAGMHLSFPGIGRLRAEGKNSYIWVPVEFSPIPKHR